MMAEVSWFVEGGYMETDNAPAVGWTVAGAFDADGEAAAPTENNPMLHPF